MVFITINASMFQAVPSPIIRSSKPYTQHRVFVERFLLLTAIVSELELIVLLLILLRVNLSLWLVLMLSMVLVVLR